MTFDHEKDQLTVWLNGVSGDSWLDNAKKDNLLSFANNAYKPGNLSPHGGKEVARELVALRLNPWWYPHDLYAPANDGSGGPFTIGRVIHSGRSVGFTDWIGGVAVFDRALSAEELTRLSAIRSFSPLSPESR